MDAALESYRQALELFRSVGDRLGEANTLAALSQMTVNSDWQQSQEFFWQADVLYKAISSIYDIGVNYRNYANSLIENGRLDEAHTVLDAAEQVQPFSPYLALRWAELAKARSDRDEAARWATEALRRQPGWDEAQTLLDWARG